MPKKQQPHDMVLEGIEMDKSAATGTDRTESWQEPAEAVHDSSDAQPYLFT